MAAIAALPQTEAPGDRRGAVAVPQPSARFSSRVGAWLEGVLAAVVLAELVILFGTVVVRHVTGQGVAWSDEVASLALAAIAFVVGAVAYYEGAHLSVRILVDRLPAGARRFVEAAGEWTVIVMSLVALALIVPSMIQNREVLTPALGISKSWAYVPYVAGMLLMVVFAAKRLLVFPSRIRWGAAAAVAAAFLGWFVAQRLSAPWDGVGGFLFGGAALVLAIVLGLPIGFGLPVVAALYVHSSAMAGLLQGRLRPESRRQVPGLRQGVSGRARREQVRQAAQRLPGEDGRLDEHDDRQEVRRLRDLHPGRPLLHRPEDRGPRVRSPAHHVQGDHDGEGPRDHELLAHRGDGRGDRGHEQSGRRAARAPLWRRRAGLLRQQSRGRARREGRRAGPARRGAEGRPGNPAGRRRLPLGWGHWASGARDVVIDGRRVKGDPRRATAFSGNAAMRVDPVLKNVTLSDLAGGSAVFYDTKVKVTRA